MNAERMVRARVICVSKAVALRGALMMPHVDRCNRTRIVENPGSIQSTVGDILRREGLAYCRKTDDPTGLSPVASTGTEWGRCGTPMAQRTPCSRTRRPAGEFTFGDLEEAFGFDSSRGEVRGGRGRLRTLLQE